MAIQLLAVTVLLLIGVTVCCFLKLISVSLSAVTGMTVVLTLWFLHWTLKGSRSDKVVNKWDGPLSNMYQSVKENPEPMEGTVVGFIPSWLCGRFFRSAPAMYEIGETKFNHWFDGLAMLMCFNISNGKATFQSRYVRSQTYQKDMAANRIVVSGFGTVVYPDPCKTIFQRTLSHFKQFNQMTETDNTWVTTYPMGKDFIVATEGDIVYCFDPVTLETKAKVKHSEYMAVNAATAHAHYDPDGTVYNMGSSFKGHPYYNIIVIPPADKTNNGHSSPMSLGKVVCSIPAKHKSRPSYYHSFAMTKNFFVFIEIPYCLHVVKMLWAYATGKPVVSAFNFHPDEKAQFYVVQRENGVVLKTQYMTSAFTFFHIVNAYEEKESIVLDLCGFEKVDYSFGLFEKMVQNNTEDLSSVRRFVLPLQEFKNPTVGVNLVQLEYTTATAVIQHDGSVFCTHETLTNGMDLPQINYREYRGRRYRYAYGVCDFNFIDGEKLVKLDVTTKTKTVWHEKDCFPSEPVFVAAPDATEEDQGVLLSAVISSDATKAPFLLIMDARTMKEMGRVVYEGAGIPRGAHGLFSAGSIPS